MAESDWHKNVETDPFRRRIFEHMVLTGLWILIRRSFGAAKRNTADEALFLRQTMIDYMDVHGGQRPEQREYRRTNHFAPLIEDERKG